MSRRHSTAGTVRQPRHVMVYRVDGSVAILRVLHDALDLPSHVDPEAAPQE